MLHLPFGRKDGLWKAFALATALIALLTFSHSNEAQVAKASIERLSQDVTTLRDVVKTFPEAQRVQKQTETLLRHQQQQINQLQTFQRSSQQAQQAQTPPQSKQPQHKLARINYALSSLGARPIHFLTTKRSRFTRQRAENALDSNNEAGHCWACGNADGTFAIALPVVLNGVFIILFCFYLS